MTKPFGIFFLILFMFSQVYNTSIWVNYELNIESITEEFCENTDKPELNCHGSCHLEKQLILNDETLPSDSQNVMYTSEIQLFHSEYTANRLERFNNNNNNPTHQTLVTNNYSYLFGLNLFHPPQA